MKANRLPINYSIKNYVECIAEDNPVKKLFDDSEKGALYKDCISLLNNRPELKKLLSISHIKSLPVDGAENFARIGVLPPKLVVVDQRIKDMCALPFWIQGKTKEGKPFKKFGSCPGYNRLPGCPPHSIPTKEVEQKLRESDLFVVLQTRLLSSSGSAWKFKVLQKLIVEIRKTIGKDAVVEKYGSGPCAACKQNTCVKAEPCASPKLRTEALESMGISVHQICCDLAEFTGQKAWEINWIKHFGLKEQTPKKWKYVVALGLRL